VSTTARALRCRAGARRAATVRFRPVRPLACQPDTATRSDRFLRTMSENEERDESAELTMPSAAVRREIELVQQFYRDNEPMIQQVQEAQPRSHRVSTR
jgi:hypothetical protein